MPEARLLRAGGVCAMVFVAVWIAADTMYLFEVGWPEEPPTLQETAALMQRPIYRLAFWLWPVAYLAVLVTALAAYQYLRRDAPVLAAVGFAFLLLYIGIWFVFHGVAMAAISVAQLTPVDERQLGTFLALIGALGSPLFWAISVFEACWGAGLLRGRGTDRLAGWAFVFGAVSSLVYFVMRYTGPNRPAESVHTLLIVLMVLGVGTLGASLLRAARSQSANSAAV